MKNVPVTKEALASLIKSVLDQARIADPTYTATTNDYINAINKIGDVVSFEYEVPTELTWIDGERMPEGSTIEEIIEDFPMPIANVPENGIIGTDVPYYPTYRKAAYSYSLGAERWRETKKHDSIQKAMRSESEANKFFADIAYKLESGYRLFRNDCKKALLGKFAMQALNNLKNATAYTATPVITNDEIGTYYKNGNIYIFAGLKKDDTVQEHLNYKDKFLDDETFQWESIAHIKEKDEILQKNAKQAFVFVRKVESENGITLPFTFVGTGQLHNPRKGVTDNGSILYDIHMDNKLPEDLMEDFKWIA